MNKVQYSIHDHDELYCLNYNFYHYCCSSKQAYLDAVLKGDAVSVEKLLRSRAIEVDTPLKVRESFEQQGY